MAPTVFLSDLSSGPSRNHLYPDTLDVFLEGGLRVRRRLHRPARGNKERRARGSVWLQSPLMGLTAEDTRHNAVSREDEEANISTTNSIDSGTEDSSNTLYRGGSSGEDCKDDKTWSRREIRHHQQQQCQRLLLLRRREGLLDITMRTVNLMRRNQQLQLRLAALQAETRAFVRSVLNNPENQAIRELTSRVRRKSSSEDEDSCKRMKIEDSTATSMEQDPAISESDSSEK